MKRANRSRPGRNTTSNGRPILKCRVADRKQVDRRSLIQRRREDAGYVDDRQLDVKDATRVLRQPLFYSLVWVCFCLRSVIGIRVVVKPGPRAGGKGKNDYRERRTRKP